MACPTFKALIRGVCEASTPNSPSRPGRVHISVVALRYSPSGVRIRMLRLIGSGSFGKDLKRRD
jgi:hypothetical protein